MSTKSDLLDKLTIRQLKEIASTEEIEIQKEATKTEIIQHLLKLQMRKIRKYVNEYTEESQIIKKEISDTWYLLPILIGFIGGLIAYLCNREYNLLKARKFLATGISVNFLMIGLFLFFLTNDQGLLLLLLVVWIAANLALYDLFILQCSARS